MQNIMFSCYIWHFICFCLSITIKLNLKFTYQPTRKRTSVYVQCLLPICVLHYLQIMRTYGEVGRLRFQKMFICKRPLSVQGYNIYRLNVAKVNSAKTSTLINLVKTNKTSVLVHLDQTVQYLVVCPHFAQT